ncbi:acyloxyacyl hydrolase [Polaribacter sp. R77954]|uniref:acyloxyacyl hydrolase n=1 Tax=Polaribacter sp. R77954 TaxID=3093870 RepID=UPI0037C939D0
MIKQFILISFLLTSFLAFNQDKKESKLKPYKVGLLYNFATNENFLNNDSDYDYTTNTYKLQAFYELTQWKSLDIELIIQPQIQFLKHQLLNKWYVTPDQDNVQEKIDEFTKPKKMHLYGVEFGFAFKKQLVKKLDIQGTLSLGFNYIDTRTERLAKGFTFNENFSLGFSYNVYSDSYIYIGSNIFGHVSNLDFQKPNDGYNIFGVEIGWNFLI